MDVLGFWLAFALLVGWVSRRHLLSTPEPLLIRSVGWLFPLRGRWLARLLATILCLLGVAPLLLSVLLWVWPVEWESGTSFLRVEAGRFMVGGTTSVPAPAPPGFHYVRGYSGLQRWSLRVADWTYVVEYLGFS